MASRHSDTLDGRQSSLRGFVYDSECLVNKGLETRVACMFIVLLLFQGRLVSRVQWVSAIGGACQN